MNKYCMKCGRELNPDTGICPVCSNVSSDKSNNQQTSKKKNNHVKKVIIAVIIFGIIVASISVALFLKKDQNLSVENLSDSNYISLSEGFTDTIVKDEHSALEAINSVAAQLGITDAEKELKNISANTVDGKTYYRFQQYYNDIPVYGRNVVLVSDTSNTATILTSNFTPVNMEEINIESFDSKKVYNAIIDFFKETENIDVTKVFLSEVSKDNAVIYNLSDNNDVFIAYIFNATIVSNEKTDFYEIVYNPEKDIVVAISPIFSDAGKSATVYSEDAKLLAEGWMINENSYELYNEKYNISIFDFNNNTVSSENGIEADLSTYGYSVISSNNNKFSSQGVSALKNTISCSEYFNSLGDNGFDSIHVAINDGYDSGNNARGGSTVEAGNSKAILLIGTNTSASDVDVCGHEYTHAVSRDIVHWAGTTKETGAINEGISDIFGELIECYCLDAEEPDWCMKGDNIEVVRSLVDPSENGYPKSIHDKLDNNSDYSHGYSTVISHAAYLMWNGIDGTEEQKIGVELLAKLWYQSMYLFQADITFNQCADIISMVAKQMNNEKTLSDKQYICVKAAFEKVGLGSKTVESGSTLLVYDINNNAYDNYHLTIKNLFESKAVVDKEVDTSEAYNIDLDFGSYVITIKDNAENGSTTVYTETITVVPALRKNYNLKEIAIFTDFGIFEKFLGEPIAPYEDMVAISSAHELYEKIQLNSSGNFYLSNDIDMSTYNNGEWKVIEEFSGKLYGNNHIIKNLSCSGQRAALFHNVSNAEIRDIGFENANISAYGDYSYASIIATTINDSSLTNCFVYNSRIKSESDAATFACFASGTEFSNLYTNAEINSSCEKSYDTGSPYVSANLGGIVAGYGDYDATITKHFDNCVVEAQISATVDGSAGGGSIHIGGIIGSLNATTGSPIPGGKYDSEGKPYRESIPIEINNCKFSGVIYGHGGAPSDSKMFDTGKMVYSACDVYAGGLIGSTDIDYGTGTGLYTGSVYISDSYVIDADITSSSQGMAYAGGLCGRLVAHSYNNDVPDIKLSNIDVSANITSCYGNGKCDMAYVGGIAGLINGSVNCNKIMVDADINVKSLWSVDAGGLCGKHYNGIPELDHVNLSEIAFNIDTKATSDYINSGCIIGDCPELKLNSSCYVNNDKIIGNENSNVSGKKFIIICE